MTLSSSIPHPKTDGLLEQKSKVHWFDEQSIPWPEDEKKKVIFRNEIGTIPTISGKRSPVIQGAF